MWRGNIFIHYLIGAQRPTLRVLRLLNQHLTSTDSDWPNFRVKYAHSLLHTNTNTILSAIFFIGQFAVLLTG